MTQDEKLIVHLLKKREILINAGELKESRLSMFKELMELGEKYRRVNQWG